jgi:hypothetical protein
MKCRIKRIQKNCRDAQTAKNAYSRPKSFAEKKKIKNEHVMQNGRNLSMGQSFINIYVFPGGTLFDSVVKFAIKIMAFVGMLIFNDSFQRLRTVLVFDKDFTQQIWET